MAATRIGARQAHEHLGSNSDSLLVCAYDDEEKFRDNHLEGALSLAELEAKADDLPKDTELIFYCA